MIVLDMEHLRSWIGREEQCEELVTPSLVERFNATFDRSGDTAYGAAAPLLMHLCLATPAVPISGLDLDGHPVRGGFLPPVPLPRRMWAGGAFTFHGDIRIGEIVIRRSSVIDVAGKEGRSGTLCFVTIAHELWCDGRDAVTELQDIVYRGAVGSGGANRQPAAVHGAYRRAVQPSAPLLFRYSALTFNGHRIHYDARYVRDVEGYPGLVVHGPLQATMLVQFAAEIHGKRPNRFSFRSLSPLFDDADFTLNAMEDGLGLRLWTSYVDGPVAMEARAEW